MAELIKSVDKNHMVSTGSEGLFGCEVDMNLFERIHSSKHIDYLNMHIWPYNWGWVTKDSLSEKLDNSIYETDKYIKSHVEVAEKIGKPIVLEEFGYPRDGFSFSRTSSVVSRDIYFSFVVENIKKSSSEGGALAGANFWGWGALPILCREDLTGEGETHSPVILPRSRRGSTRSFPQIPLLLR